jgi:hypothetical protein
MPTLKQLSLPALLAFSIHAPTHAVTPDLQPLIRKSDFTYLGAFALPQGDYGASRFGYGGAGLSYYYDSIAGRHTLFMQGHAWYPGFVAQVEVPGDAHLEMSHTWDDFAQATVLQQFSDVTDGSLSSGIGDGASVYGMLGYGGRLIVGASMYYDAGGDQVNSHGVCGLDLSATNDFLGFFPMHGAANPRSKGGYMTTIPSEWRGLLGGPALTGKGGLPIISSNGCGPAATVFDPADVGRSDTIPGVTLLYYPLSDPLYDPTTQNPFFNLSTEITGVAFPPGSRSVLYFGKHGTGPYCYGCGCGEGTPGNPTCAPSADCPEYCYDPVDGSKGTHAYPYAHQVWAYDANDLVDVRNGTRQPHDVSPYEIWRLDELDTTGSAGMAGAGYDPLNGRLYIAEHYAEEPHVHVYQVDVSSAIRPARVGHAGGGGAPWIQRLDRNLFRVTITQWQTPAAGPELTVCRLDGEVIARSPFRAAASGSNHCAEWDATHVARGIYLVRVRPGDSMPTWTSTVVRQ